MLALVWGYNWVVIKIATGGASPFVLVAIRMVLGAGGAFRDLGSRAEAPQIAAGRTDRLIGMFQVGLMTTFQTLALATGGAGKDHAAGLHVSVLDRAALARACSTNA